MLVTGVENHFSKEKKYHFFTTSICIILIVYDIQWVIKKHIGMCFNIEN